jgi:hypothetical protein
MPGNVETERAIGVRPEVRTIAAAGILDTFRGHKR